jgi:hypothetical protein
MTLGEMREWLVGRLQATEGVDYSTARLNKALNEGVRYVAQRLTPIKNRLNVVTDACDVVEGVSRYALPQDFLRIHEVKFDGEAVAEWPPERLSEETGYYLDGLVLVLGWVPDADIAGGLVVKHSAAIAMTDDGDIPQLPIDLHMIAVVHAERLLKPLVGEDAKGKAQEIEEMLGNLSSYFKENNAELPTMRPTNLPSRNY